jgi:DNA polymerase-3 subunit delta
VTERLHDGPVRLGGAAAAIVEAHLGEDVGRLGALLDLLAASYGVGAHLGVEEVEPFRGEAGGVAPWELTDAIDAGDTAAALAVLHRLLGGGQRPPLVVMATLQRHYTDMLRLDGAAVSTDAQAAELLGTKPYPAAKAMRQARRLGSAAVGRAVTLLADADLDLRGRTGWPEDLVLDVLVARLSRLVPPERARGRGRG